MARVHTQKAGKDYPEQGIKKGDTYYRWTVGFRGREQRSKTPPPRSATIGSATLSAAVACEEGLQAAVQAATSAEDVKTACDDAANEAESVISDFEDKINNLEQAFPSGCPALEEAQEQLDTFQSWKDELESFDHEDHKPDSTDLVDKEDEEELLTLWRDNCRAEVPSLDL